MTTNSHFSFFFSPQTPRSLIIADIINITCGIIVSIFLIIGVHTKWGIIDVPFVMSLVIWTHYSIIKNDDVFIPALLSTLFCGFFGGIAILTAKWLTDRKENKGDEK